MVESHKWDITRKCGRTSPLYSVYNDDISLAVYKSLIKPNLQYTIQVWSLLIRNEVNKLDSVQQTAAKLVPELAGLDYEE